MSTPVSPNESELFARIREAASHYAFDLPLTETAPRERLPRLASLAAVALVAAGGVILTLAVVGVLGGPPFNTVGSIGPVASSLRSPDVVTGATQVPVDVAARVCRQTADAIPSDWLQPDVTAADIRARLIGLPLVHDEQRTHAALFVFADDRYVTLCTVARRAAAAVDDHEGLSIATGLLNDPHGLVDYSFGMAGSGAEDVPWNMVMAGAAARDVASVGVRLADGKTVGAWLGDGVWVAWWNEPIASREIVVRSRSGSEETIEQRFTPPSTPP